MESESISDGVLLCKPSVPSFNVLNEMLFELSHLDQAQHGLDAEFLAHPMHQNVQFLGVMEGLQELFANVPGLLVVAEHSVGYIDPPDIDRASPLPTVSDLEGDPQRG